MKSDTTVTVLNFVLVLLVICGVIFALLSIQRTREFRLLTATATFDQSKLMNMQTLANDVAAFNATAKSSELTHILQSIQPKPAAH